MFVEWVRLCFLSTKKQQISELVEWCNNTASIEKAKQLDFIKTALELFRFSYLIDYNPALRLPK